MSSMLEFQNICKYFPGVKALDNISFKAYAGEVLAFLGENGAGKSTLLKVLNGDYQPTSRSTVVDSSIPRKQTRWHQRSWKILVFRSTRRQKSKI